MNLWNISEDLMKQSAKLIGGEGIKLNENTEKDS